MMKYSWKKRLTAAIACGVFALTSAPALADDVELTLEESIELALNNNQSIKIAAAEYSAAQWALKEAQGAKSFSISLSHSDDWFGGDLPVTKNKKEFSNAVSAKLPIYTGGKLESTIEQAKIGKEVKRLGVDDTMQQIKLDVTKGYFNILQTRNLVQVSEESVNQLEEHLKNVRAQYAVGTVAKSDVLRSEVELADAQQELIKAQNNQELAMSNFNNIVGMPLDTQVKIREEMRYDEYDLTLDNSILYALAHRPDGVAAQKSVEMAEQAVDIAKAGQRPTVSLAAANTWEDTSFPGDDTSTWNVGLTTNWNVFDGNVTRSQIKQAEANLIKSKEQARQTQDGIQLEVRQAYLNMKEAEKRIQTSKVTVEKAQEDFKIAQVRYSAGVGTNIDVIDAQVALTKAQTNYIQSLYDYNTSKAALDKAMGIDVEQDAPEK